VAMRWDRGRALGWWMGDLRSFVGRAGHGAMHGLVKSVAEDGLGGGCGTEGRSREENGARW